MHRTTGESCVPIQGLERVCHELRRPLTVILALGDLLRDRIEGPLNAGQEDDLTEILLNAHSLELVIRDLYDLGSASSRAALQPDRVRPEELCASLIEELGANPRASQLDLRLECEGSPLPITLDPGALRAALSRLLESCVGFLEPGDELTLRVTDRNGKVQLEVEDSGPRVPEEELEQLFQPYHRPWDGRGAANPEGLGCGLAICHTQIETLGGRVEAENHARGMRFRVELPAAEFAAGSRAEGNHADNPRDGE